MALNLGARQSATLKLLYSSIAHSVIDQICLINWRVQLKHRIRSVWVFGAYQMANIPKLFSSLVDVHQRYRQPSLEDRNYFRGKPF